jgi:hypothetical protein
MDIVLNLYSMIKAFAKYICILSVFVIFNACNRGVKGSDELQGFADSTVVNDDDKQKVSAQNVFYFIPSPIETINLLKDAGAEYNMDFLNGVDKLKTYSTDDKKALNLGVYGCDLSFAGVFEKAQESILYLKCVNSLSKSLGITEAFNETTNERLELNKDKKDSVLQIISESFWQADASLKESNRGKYSSLLVVGGWIEGVHIAGQVALASSMNKDVLIRFTEQKLSLDYLIQLVESTGVESETQYILEELRSIQKSFLKVNTEFSETSASTNKKDKITSIKSAVIKPIDKVTFDEILLKVEALRDKIIKA